MVKIFKTTFILIFLVGIYPDLGVGQENENFTNIAERFSGNNPNSKAKIDHSPFTDYLYDTVFPGGRSKKFLGQKKVETYRASHIKTTETLAPSRFEGGRLFLPYFSADHVDFFLAYQEGLENVSNQRAISKFNKNEQLAYWLNLYNVIVINKLAEEYPIQNLKPFFKSKKGKPSFKDEKVTTIEGLPLSLRDIENILFSKYDSSLVAFGLWQGAIGGPRILNFAFTGENVWRALEKNAVEFVNSNRGLRPPRGSKMKVSEFYEMMLPAFGNSENDILNFIKRYADPNFVTGVQQVTSISPKIFDWTSADILGGVLHSGQDTQLGGLQASQGGGQIAAAGISTGGSYGGFRPDAIYKFILDKTPTGPLTILPPQVQEFVIGILENNELPTPNITTEECAPGEACGALLDPDGA